MKSICLSATICTFIILLAACSPSSGTATSRLEPYNPIINPTNFVASVDNPFFPLSPGSKFTYERQTEEGLEHNEVVVLEETKEILGVNTTAVQDTVWLDGEVSEDTTDWYAQDKDGNVWYFGEDTKEYSNGDVSSTAGTWMAGVDGSMPGIIMPANPQIGVEYRQEYYAGEAEDMAKVVSLNESVSVPYGSFEGCLRTEEWTPLEPGVLEAKIYCPGVGNVQTISLNPTEEPQNLISVETQ